MSLALPLQQFGLVPRTLQGLVGIFTSPLLHGSLQHLISNSMSFALFAIILAILEGQQMFVKILLIMVIGGVLTWLMGRNANHIGASGVIFGLWGYIILAGWFSRQFKYIVISITIIFFYSGMIFGVFPGRPDVSWEGHLFGVIAGILVAWIYHKK